MNWGSFVVILEVSFELGDKISLNFPSLLYSVVFIEEPLLTFLLVVDHFNILRILSLLGAVCVCLDLCRKKYLH